MTFLVSLPLTQVIVIRFAGAVAMGDAGVVIAGDGVGEELGLTVGVGDGVGDGEAGDSEISNLVDVMVFPFESKTESTQVIPFLNPAIVMLPELSIVT